MCKDKFEKLKELARNEFGCEIVRNQNKSTFKELFGFDKEDIDELKEK